VAEGRYTLTELTIARRTWPNPNRRVLPVMARKISLELVPAYLKGVTILTPEGNLGADTSAAVENMRSISRVGVLRNSLLVTAILAVALMTGVFSLRAMFKRR